MLYLQKKSFISKRRPGIVNVWECDIHTKLMSGTVSASVGVDLIGG